MDKKVCLNVWISEPKLLISTKTLQEPCQRFWCVLPYARAAYTAIRASLVQYSEGLKGVWGAKVRSSAHPLQWQL